MPGYISNLNNVEWITRQYSLISQSMANNALTDYQSVKAIAIYYFSLSVSSSETFNNKFARRPFLKPLQCCNHFMRDDDNNTRCTSMRTSISIITRVILINLICKFRHLHSTARMIKDVKLYVNGYGFTCPATQDPLRT